MKLSAIREIFCFFCFFFLVLTGAFFWGFQAIKFVGYYMHDENIYVVGLIVGGGLLLTYDVSQKAIEKNTRESAIADFIRSNHCKKEGKCLYTKTDNDQFEDTF